jgi:hypothetical protein
VYGVGEAIRIFYRVDGQLGDQPITQAQVTIIDIPSNNQGTVILSGGRPAGQTLFIDATVSPPTGIEMLRLQAEAPGFTQIAQDHCSFQVTAQCQTACDCPTGELCDDQGICQMGITPVYCCSHGPCPAGATCQEVGGQYAPCPMAP